MSREEFEKWALEKSAQLWCNPPHTGKEFDADLCRSIIDLLLEARDKALDEIVDALRDSPCCLNCEPCAICVLSDELRALKSQGGANG